MSDNDFGEESICKKCQKRKDIRELYDMIIICQGHIHTFGERDCAECRENQLSGENPQI